MDKDPKVSIIILNFNGKSYLKKCLESLMKVKYPKFEIILVDNNSSDDSIEFVKNRFPSVIIIKLDKNYGCCYPRNVGAKKATGDLLLFLDNDTIVDPQFMTELVNVIKKDPKITICQCMLLKPDGEVDSSGDFIDALGSCFSSKDRIKETREILSARGASIMVRKDAFEKLGGFDNKFVWGFEDIDLGWRNWIIGNKSVLAPNSIVYHLGELKPKTPISKIRVNVPFNGYKNHLSMNITNFEFQLAIKSLILFFIINGIRMLKILLDYKIYGKTKITAKHNVSIAPKPDLKIYFQSILWLIKNVNYLRRKHKNVNSQRIVSTKELKNMKIIMS